MSDPGRVLVVAPHADDETLGMGGTIARLAAEGRRVTVAVLTGHGAEPHPLWPPATWETVRAEAGRAMSELGVEDLRFSEVPAARVAEEPPWRLNRMTDELVREVAPEILYVPFPLDLHKDHREIFHSLSVAWRPNTEHGRRIREVHCYEVVSETHWNVPYVEQGFLPTCWVDVSDQLAAKLRAVGCYESQLSPGPGPRSLAAVEALARWRGSQIGVAAAEAFVTVRLLR